MEAATGSFVDSFILEVVCWGGHSGGCKGGEEEEDSSLHFGLGFDDLNGLNIECWSGGIPDNSNVRSGNQT